MNATSEPSSGHFNLKARKGWLWGAAEQLLQRGLTMVVSLVLARMLDPEAFGLIASVSIFFAVAQQLIDGGIGSRIVQKKEILEEDYLAFFWCNAGMSLLTCGLLVVFSQAIALFYGDPKLQPVVMVMAVVVFLMNAGRVQDSRLIRELQFKKFSLVVVISVLAGSIAGLILAFAGAGVWAILGQQLVFSLTRAVALWRIEFWRPSGLPAWRAVKDLYSFGLPLMVSQTIRGFSEQLINALGARYVGMTPLGFYDRGRFIPGNAATFVQCIFFRTNLTLLSKLQHRDDEFRSVYLDFLQVVIPFCSLLLTGLAVCAPEIIEVVLGAKWLPSIWYFRAGCVMSGLYLFFLINQEALRAKGAVAELFRQNIIYAILQVVFVSIGLVAGLPGMFAGLILGCGVSCLLHMRVVGMKSLITVSSQFRVLVKPFFWALFMTLLMLWIRLNVAALWIKFMLCGITGAITLGLFLYIIFTEKTESKSEL